MTVALDSSAFPVERVGVLDRTGALALAAAASIGAGAIHAAAVGVHNEHPQAVRAFVAVAAFQLLWGTLALTRNNRTLALAGAVGNAALIGGWLMAKASGISFIDGMEAKEAVQFADGLAAAFAVVAVVGAAIAAVRPMIHPRQFVTAVAVIAITGLTIPGMVKAGGHSHAGHDAGTAAVADDGHDHAAGVIDPTGAGGANLVSDTASAATDSTSHDHSDTTAAEEDPTTADESDIHDHSATTVVGDMAPDDSHSDHETVTAKPYDPTQPIDLSGTEGVTPEQQAQAENVIAITLLRLPKFADPKVAEALGWQSIGDGATGHEHYINWDIIEDEDWLNPDMPESLVYEPDGAGGKKLVSAMFMLPKKYSLENVPDIGGKLMQWHIHDNLCFTGDPALTDEPVLVRGLTNGEGGCNAPLFKFNENAMIHVWITPHQCGPFAALEGVGAGQIKPGEERLCDVAHGTGENPFG